MNEFETIRAFFDWPTQHTALGVGDDAALCLVPPAEALAISSDMLVAGRHFFENVDPEALGHKALAVNLSDMAAMGAVPKQFTLSIALPGIDRDWLEQFARGLRKIADAFNCDLVGGDTTAGPLNIAITILGHVPAAQALKRSGARVGDDIYVSGNLGAARLGLQQRLGRIPQELSDADKAAAYRAMDRPTPRVALGQALRRVATAAMDLSDGLAGDLSHLARASQCQAVVCVDHVPVAPCVARCLGGDAAAFAISGGDDYELLFSAPACHREGLRDLAVTLGVPITRIGHMETNLPNDQPVRFVNAKGRDIALEVNGFDHFAAGQ